VATNHWPLIIPSAYNDFVDSLLLRVAGTVARWLPTGARRSLYHLGPLTRLLRLSLNRAAPAGVHAVEIAAGPLAGAQLLLDLQVDKDLWLGNYEPEVQSVIARLLQPGMTAYDLGANIGYFTLMMARSVGEGGRVIAAEALPANVERLREAIRLNRLEERVLIVAKAVGAKAGRQRFLIHASAGMGRLESAPGRPDGFEGSLDVEVGAIDDWVYRDGLPAPDLVKLDIEGGEGPALEGMRTVLTRAAPILVIEVHGALAARSVWTELTSAGYSIFDVDQAERPVASPTVLKSKAHLLARVG
jgi:FkbM family methyltransferase